MYLKNPNNGQVVYLDPEFNDEGVTLTGWKPATKRQFQAYESKKAKAQTKLDQAGAKAAKGWAAEFKDAKIAAAMGKATQAQAEMVADPIGAFNKRAGV